MPVPFLLFFILLHGIDSFLPVTNPNIISSISFFLSALPSPPVNPSPRLDLSYSIWFPFAFLHSPASTLVHVNSVLPWLNISDPFLTLQSAINNTSDYISFLLNGSQKLSLSFNEFQNLMFTKCCKICLMFLSLALCLIHFSHYWSSIFSFLLALLFVHTVSILEWFCIPSPHSLSNLSG